MATIAATTIEGGFKALTETTLTAGNNPLTFSPEKAPVLILRNDSGSAISANISGTTASTVECDGLGSVDVSSGLTHSVPANSVAVVKLNEISGYLSGVINVTGTNLKAQLLNLA